MGGGVGEEVGVLDEEEGEGVADGRRVVGEHRRQPHHDLRHVGPQRLQGGKGVAGCAGDGPGIGIVRANRKTKKMELLRISTKKNRVLSRIGK